MNQVVELNKLVYFFKDKENRHENKLLLVQEKENNQVSWRPLSKGWEYQLWYQFGERGGLAEANEILLHDNGEDKAVTIEEYVKSCRDTLDKAISADTIFERFTVKAIASRKKEIKNKYVVETLEKDYELKKIEEDEERIYYEKQIETVEQLEKIAVHWVEKEHEVQMVFTEKK